MISHYSCRCPFRKRPTWERERSNFVAEVKILAVFGVFPGAPTSTGSSVSPNQRLSEFRLWAWSYESTLSFETHLIAWSLPGAALPGQTSEKTGVPKLPQKQVFGRNRPNLTIRGWIFISFYEIPADCGHFEPQHASLAACAQVYDGFKVGRSEVHQYSECRERPPNRRKRWLGCPILDFLSNFDLRASN